MFEIMEFSQRIVSGFQNYFELIHGNAETAIWRILYQWCLHDWIFYIKWVFEIDKMH